MSRKMLTAYPSRGLAVLKQGSVALHIKNRERAKSRSSLLSLPVGAGEGNRTLVFSLGSWCSAIELHPREARFPFERGTKIVVGVAGFEPAASWSRTKHATICATPRQTGAVSTPAGTDYMFSPGCCQAFSRGNKLPENCRVYFPASMPVRMK